MITFLSPVWLLIGLGAALIPLIIHLSRSRRTKKMRFSTTRFFTEQFLRSYRMSRLKELLLLACRMALCGILGLALSRPLLLPRGQAVLTGGSRSVVLVLDNSASMGFTEDGATLLDRARASARNVLDSLRPGDSASVVLAGRRGDGPEVLFKEPTHELGDVLQAVNSVQVAPLGTDLAAAVTSAEKVAQGSNANSKEVYVLSDLQDSGWELQDQQAAAGSDVLFFFVQVRPKVASNVAVTALQYAAARPMVGVPFAIRPHLSVQGQQSGSCAVRLFVDGAKVGEQQVEKNRAGRWAIPRFYHTFTTGGWHSGYVEVDDDALPLDNRRYFAFEVLDSVKVLAVDGAPSDVPRLDELFFLKAALTASPAGKSPIQIDVAGTPELARTDLAKYPLVIVANAETLPAPAIEKLEAFVDGGGNLLFFLGDKVNATLYNQNLAVPSRLHGGLLPARLVKIEGDPKADEGSAFVGDVDYDHPVLAAFHEPHFANLAGVTFKALWRVEPGADAAVLMRTNTGLPLLCEKPFGKGRVALFTSTCDRDWTNFPVRPAYLPWTHRLVGYLAQEPLGRQSFYASGERLLLPASATQGVPQVMVKKPDGSSAYATTTDDPDHPLAFADTNQVGIYSLTLDRKQNAGLFAVNLESYESDLTYLDDVLAERDDRPDVPRQARVEAGLRGLLSGHPPELITFVDEPDRVNDIAQGARRGIKLWDVFLFVVLLLALFEPWLANRISLRLYARPKAVAVPPAPPGAAGRVLAPEAEMPAQEVGPR